MADAGRGVGAALAGLVGFVLLAGTVEAQDWATAQFSRQLQDETSVDVEVHYGAGRLSLSPLAGEELYRLRLEYDEDGFEPVHEYRDGHLELGLTGSRRGLPFPRSERGRSEMDLGLSTRVPMDLRLDFGAVRASMDLGGMRLRTLRLNTGASDSQLRVSRPNPYPMERAHLAVGAASFEGERLGNLNAREIEVEAGVGSVQLDFGGLQREETRLEVQMGLGSLELNIPRGVGVRLERSTLLTSLSLPDFEERDGAHYSPEWAEAAHRLYIDVQAAFGSLSVIRTDG